MTAAWEVIDSQTLGSSAASVTFSSIPSGYRDLVLVIDGLGTSAAQVGFRVNSDSSNYNNVEMAGNGSTTSSGAGSSASFGYVDYNASSLSGSVRSTLILQAMDYSAADKHKTFLWRGGRSDAWANASAVRWGSTSAINSLTIYGNFAATSSFTLYGSNRA